MEKIRTAEYARCGHPDRVCDIISDALVDEFIKQDPMSRVAINVFGCAGIITVGGEVTTGGYVEIQDIVKRVYKEIGYKDEIGVQVNITSQSSEIGDKANVGAGDSGIMTGYATRETPEMLPLEVVLAKKVCDYLDGLVIIAPDGKVQVTLEDNKINTLVVAYQGVPEVEGMLNDEISKLLSDCITDETEFKFIPFQLGGFTADTGMTGRKNVLWYGPKVPTGGGAFAGKDPTKVDRSGAYWARRVAIGELKTNKELQECLVEVAFVIGKNEPVMVKINGEERSTTGITVSGILKILDLRKPIYKEASLCGHFGNKKLKWEV